MQPTQRPAIGVRHIALHPLTWQAGLGKSARMPQLKEPAPLIAVYLLLKQSDSRQGEVKFLHPVPP